MGTLQRLRHVKWVDGAITRWEPYGKAAEGFGVTPWRVVTILGGGAMTFWSYLTQSWLPFSVMVGVLTTGALLLVRKAFEPARYSQAPRDIPDVSVVQDESAPGLTDELPERLDRMDAALAALSARHERERIVMLHMLHQQTLATSITTATEVLAAMSEDAVGHHLENDDMRRAGYEGAVKLAVGKLRHMRGFDALGEVMRAAELNAENDFSQMDPRDFGDMHPAEMRRYRIAIDQWERVARYVREQREELVWELAGEASTLQRAARQLGKPDTA